MSEFQKDVNKLLKIIFKGITTIGVKLFKFHKYMMPYKMERTPIPLGKVSVKIEFFIDQIPNYFLNIMSVAAKLENIIYL
ncbi:nickel insertion protein [Clostridium aromativorans]|uniref:nickel insertion protein n=1 Tax=Clostridium aromativorans TaxID=2836848 RepID=UPI001E4A4235|nr:nickel insertion protein [Clostridium aromativorans]